MKKFKFKLDNVLNLRQKKEDIQKKELAEAKKIYELEVEILADLKHKKVISIDDYKRLLNVTIDVNKIKVSQNYIKRLDESISRQVDRIEECRVVVEEKIADLLYASKEKKVVEKLHDKRYTEYITEHRKNEDKLIDEVATITYGKRPNIL